MSLLRPVTILVAPNGARLSRDDHARLPITVPEIARCAAESREAGADGIHAHIRDTDGGHLLDATVYRELASAIAREAGPDFFVQITTEAIGRYQVDHQIGTVLQASPDGASCALRELVPDEASEDRAGRFFADCVERGIAIQHILYEAHEVDRLADLISRGVVPGQSLSVIIVLGRKDLGQSPQDEEFLAFMVALRKLPECQWMACAFGQAETRYLAAAMALGGHIRVGFENSLVNADGEMARDNAERVSAIARLRSDLGLSAPTPGIASKVLGRPQIAVA